MNSSIQPPAQMNITDTNTHQPRRRSRRVASPASPSRVVTAMLLEVATDLTDWQAAAGVSFADIFAGWSTPQYLFAARRELAELPENSDRLKLLRQMACDAVSFQRGGYWAPRLQLERDRLALAHQKRQDALAAAQPKPKKYRDPKAPLSEEDRKAILNTVDEIMGLK